MTSEEWRSVVGWEDRYEVSDQGRVRAKERVMWVKNTRRVLKRTIPPRMLDGGIDAAGYVSVGLSRGRGQRRHLVHRLVLFAFVGPPPKGKPHGCHYNGIRRDPRLVNLRWDSALGNGADRIRHIQEWKVLAQAAQI
jgi:hypothetical protein